MKTQYQLGSFLIVGCVLVSILQAKRLLAQDFPTIEFVPYVSGLSSPLDVVGSPFGNKDLYVVQRGTVSGSAQIKTIKQGAILPQPFLTVTDISCCGERGLLSMVFHPDAATNGTFFVYYTAATTGAVTIARYKLKALDNLYEADPDSRQVIISIPHVSNTNHNGGKLLFGPDGYLYIGTGDGGSSNDPQGNAQNPQSLLGKMLRINPLVNSTSEPHYTIPPDNPYTGASDGVPDEIYSFGLRNPWRWSFDKTTGNAWIADVGQGAMEELNMVSSTGLNGANFGWRCFEGTLTNNAAGIQPCTLYNAQVHTQPKFEYPHNPQTGGYSVTGGYVYRGTQHPAMAGFYLMADYVSQALWVVKTDGGFNAVRQTEGVPSKIVGFGETYDNELWAVSLTGGTIYSIRPYNPLALQSLSLTGKINGNHHLLEWTTAVHGTYSTIEVQKANSGQGDFSTIALINLAANTGNLQHFHVYNPETNSRIFYRLKAIGISGEIVYSNTIMLQTIERGPNLFITRNGTRATAFMAGKPRHITVSDIMGRTILSSKIPSGNTVFSFELPENKRGVLVVTVIADNGVHSTKFRVL